MGCNCSYFCKTDDDLEKKSFEQERRKINSSLIEEATESENEGEEGIDDISRYWSEESLEWYKVKRMRQLSQFIINKHCQLSLSGNEEKKYLIWNKFDINRKNRLRTKKYLPQLLYGYIWLIVKSERRSPPKYKQLQNVLEYYSDNIRQILPNDQKEFLEKDHYYQYISLYIEEITNHRC